MIERREYLMPMPCCGRHSRIVMVGWALETEACERCGAVFTLKDAADIARVGQYWQRISNRYPKAETPTVIEDAWEKAMWQEHPTILEGISAAAGPYRSGSRFRGD